MYILNKNHFTNKDKDILRLHKSFSNKQWKPQHLMAMIKFLSDESKIFTLEEALNNITMIQDQIPLEEEVLDFSNIDFSKCGSVRKCISNATGLYNLYFANIKNVDNINDTYDTDGDRRTFFYNVNFNSLHINNCTLTGNEEQYFYDLFSFGRGNYAKDIVIENSELRNTNIYNSNYTLPIERLLVKDSKLYMYSYYGRLCGDFNDKCKSIEFINSTIIPRLYDGIFRSQSPNIREINLPNISNEGTCQLTTTANGFSDCQYLEVINFNGLDTSALTNMSNLFLRCSSLLSVTGLEDKVFDKVTNISNMFKECTNLVEIPNVFNGMTEVTDLNALFHSCSSLIEIKLELNIPKCSMYAMIYNNASLEKVDLSKVVIDPNRGTADKINFTENLKFCPKLKEIHLGLMRCGVIFQMQQLDNSPNIKRVFIPKETNMGVADVDGWYYSGNNVGIFQNCAKDCIIYTDADYSFSYDTQQATGTKPANWLDRFNNHYGDGGAVKGLTIIGNTSSDDFFQEIQPTDTGDLSTYVIPYRDIDTYQEKIISGKSILKCYISQDNNLTFNNVKQAIQNNQVTEVPYSNILKTYYKGNGKLDIKFKIQEYIKTHKPKMIMLDVKNADTNTKTINAFYMQQIGVTDPSFDPNTIPVIPNPTETDFEEIFNNNESNSNGIGGFGSGNSFNSGNGGNAGNQNYGGDQAGNIQVTDDEFKDSGPKIFEENGDVFITDGNKKIEITPNKYYDLLSWLQRVHPDKLEFYGRNILLQAMFSSVRYALAGHTIYYAISYYRYHSYKVNNFALNFIDGKPALLYKKNGTNDMQVDNALAKKAYDKYASLLEEWKRYYNKTEDDFKRLYDQSKFSLFEVDYSKDLPEIIKKEQTRLFPQWNYIEGPNYNEGASIVINKLQNQGIDAWYL